MQPNFHFYATLLDSFAWYKRNENEGAKQEFLDRVNRVPTPKTDAMIRGIEFENAITLWAKRGGGPPGPLKVHDLEVSPALIAKFSTGFERALRQVFVEVNLPTRYGEIRVYGFIDDLMADTAYDTKTTKSYELGKYRKGWQHPAYLTALKWGGSGVNRFVYRITDFEDYFEEEYVYRPEDTERLIVECEHLAEFMEENRAQITDKKVFKAAA